MCFIKTEISENYFSEYLSALTVFKIKVVLLLSSKFYVLSMNLLIHSTVFQTQSSVPRASPNWKEKIKLGHKNLSLIK